MHRPAYWKYSDGPKPPWSTADRGFLHIYYKMPESFEIELVKLILDNDIEELTQEERAKLLIKLIMNRRCLAQNPDDK